MHMELNRTASPEIGIVTVLYRSREVLDGFFASLARQIGITFRIYVIDNGPTNEDTIVAQRLAEKYRLDTTLIFNNANLGVAKGNNQGIELALKEGCRYVLLSNNDIEFSQPGAILELKKVLEAEQAIDAVTPKIYFFGTTRLWFAGGGFSKLKGINTEPGMGDMDIGQYDHSRVISYAPTCFVLFRTEVFNRVGLMDEKYFVYYDDTDFLLRMRRASVILKYVPSISIEHKVSFSSGGRESDFSLYYNHRNRLYFLTKNYRGLKRLFYTFIYFGTLAFKLLKANTSQRKVLVKSVLDGRKM